MIEKLCFPCILTPKQIKKETKALTLYSWQKRRERKTLKGRELTCGGLQKKHLTKEEVYSLTSNTTAVFLIATIEAEEEQDVRVHNILNASVQSDNDEQSS